MPLAMPPLDCAGQRRRGQAHVAPGPVPRSRRARGGADDGVPRQRRDAAGRGRRRTTSSCLLLERGGQTQLVYKHAISTMQPAAPLDLGSAESDDALSVFNRSDDSGIARGERALLVVPDRGGDGKMRSIDARLDEAAGLAAAIGIDVVERKSFRLRQVRPASLFGKGQAEEMADIAAHRRPDLDAGRHRADAGPAEEPRGDDQVQGDRPHRADPRNLRRARRDGRRAAAGRAGPSRLSGRAAGAQLDPSRAPARRLRLPRRSGRNPDRGRSAHDPRPHGAHPQGARPGQAHPRAPPRAAAEGAVAGDRAGRLHQCRKVDPVQPHDRRPR